MNLLNLLKGSQPPRWSIEDMILEFRRDLGLLKEFIVQHVFKAGNKVVSSLANLAIQKEELTVLEYFFHKKFWGWRREIQYPNIDPKVWWSNHFWKRLSWYFLIYNIIPCSYFPLSGGFKFVSFTVAWIGWISVDCWSM